MATAADVPGVYDVVINGQGYVFLDSIEPSLPFRTHRASYSLTPTFISRQNVSGDFGDNQQDFYLTYTQNDWSLGEGQRYFRTDDVRSRKYWVGDAVRIDVPGEVSMLPAVDTPSAIIGETITSITSLSAVDWIAFGTTGAYQIQIGGIITALGAHGIGGVAADLDSATTDQKSVYVVGGVAHGVIKYTAGGGFVGFSGNGASSLAFLNNTLFGFRNSIGDLVSWSSAGVLNTATFTWKNADGTPAPGGSDLSAHTCIRAFGSQLLLLRRGGAPTVELWSSDGISSTTRVAEFPSSFTPYEMCVSNGFAYISGYFVHNSTQIFPAIFSYDGQSRVFDIVWQAPDHVSSTYGRIPLCPYQKGIAFLDDSSGLLRYFDATTQAISTIAAFVTIATGLNHLASSQTGVTYGNAGTFYTFPSATTSIASTVLSSLIDFGSSLEKRFKAVKVDWEPGSDGDGGHVDILYKLNSVDQPYTGLVGSAVAGVEYPIDQSGRSISIQVAMYKGTSTYGPKLKRIYVRAVPIQPQFKLRSYVLDVTGSSKKRDTWIKLRSGRHHTKDGMAMAADLLTAVAAQTPITITDRLGTFTGIIQPDQFEILEVHPGEFVAQVVAREV